MDGPYLLILTGPPGAGKTTVGALVAARSALAAHIESDWFWTTLVSGRTDPWERAADPQNRAVVRASVAAAARLAAAGYATVLDGIVGPWHLDLVREELGALAVPVSYVVLRPAREHCLTRAVDRVDRDPRHRGALTRTGPIVDLWQQFSDLGDLERLVVDNSAERPDQTAERIARVLATHSHRLPVA